MEAVVDDYFRGIFQSPDPSEESIEEALPIGLSLLLTC